MFSTSQQKLCEQPSPVVAATPTPEAPAFDWDRQWYPMMVLEDADPEVPHATQLLGKDLVIWRDKQGQWR